MTVLLIDDDSIFHLIHRKLLGFNADIEKVTEASSGAAALQLLQEASSETMPDVILVDLDMPGMGGFEFVEKYIALGLREKKKSFISMLSSSSSFEDTERAKKLGVAFLNKPLDVGAMRSAMGGGG